MVRLFVAIKTSRSFNAALSHAAGLLKLFGGGSFCGEDTYHITLAFIGESDRVSDIKQVLDGVDTAPFEVHLSKLGSFGNTVYVGVDPSKELGELQRQISDGLRAAGFDIENRPFVPHITLARRYKSDMEPVVFVPAASQRVEEVLLMQSVDGTYKTIYTKTL